jgi:hypothetical protein
MPLPYYVSPEQMMKDKAEYARKGISRGKAIVTIEYRDGVLLVAENPSTLLHKISEIYDRIAFAGEGKYNEFENMRVAGVRHADVKGYSYSRRTSAPSRSPTPTRGRSATSSPRTSNRSRSRCWWWRWGRQRHQERDLPHPLRRHDRGREELRRDGRRSRRSAAISGQLPGEPRPPRGPQEAWAPRSPRTGPRPSETSGGGPDGPRRRVPGIPAGVHHQLLIDAWALARSPCPRPLLLP